MLSADDVTPTPEVDDPVTSSGRRSSVSCDGKDENASSGLRRRGSFMGSMTSLCQWRGESIVEALEKKCRENVSSRLRSQLPRHLQKSSVTTCTELPVIVHQTTSGLLRPPTNGVTRGPSMRSNSQLYQTITPASSPGGRRAASVRSLVPADCSPRSLSLCRQPRRSNVTPEPRNASASSTLERKFAARTWTEDKRATLPDRLDPSAFYQAERLRLNTDCDDVSDQSASSSSASSTVMSRFAATKHSDCTANQLTKLHQPDQPEMLRPSANDSLDLLEPAWSATGSDQHWTVGKHTCNCVINVTGNFFKTLITRFLSVFYPKIKKNICKCDKKRYHVFICF